jgi:dsDNA-binding SOS-regulon protein
MEPINIEELKASKKVKALIADLQTRLLHTEDVLEDMTRAAEIVEVTGQREILSTWIQQSNEFLRDRMVRPDSSISADNYKMTIVTDDAPVEDNKNVT